MKERFLNIFLFLISFCLIGAGIVFMFFNNIEFVKVIFDKTDSFILNPKITSYFLSIIGSIVFTWGVFFFLLTVFTVMELKSNNVYGFIFWGYTFWIASMGVITFINKFYFMLIALGALYCIVFFPFLLSLPMKSGINKE